MSEQGRINDIIKSRHGVNLVGQPLFRISWSDAQTEKRFGVYNEFYGDIFVREIRGLREVPKYPYVKERWVLERWMPPALAYTSEIPSTAEGSYEPLFVFQTEQGESLPLNEEVIHKMIHMVLHPQLPGDRMSDLRQQERDAFDLEVKQNLEELEDAGRSWIGHRLHSKEAIVKP